MNNCSACFFYRVDPRNLRQGTCRFNPPAPMLIMSQTGQPVSMGTFPPVQENEWCGKWEINPRNLNA